MRKMVARLLADAGVTTILVTHDQSEALSFADQLAVMRDGRLVQSGHPLDLYRYPEDEQTALFLGDAVVMPAESKPAGPIANSGGYRSTTTGTTNRRRSCCVPNNCNWSASSPARPEAAGCRAVVTERDFSGNTCTLTVELQSLIAGQQPGRSLMVRSSGLYAPPAGSAVHVSTIGHAHVLSEVLNPIHQRSKRSTARRRSLSSRTS